MTLGRDAFRSGGESGLSQPVDISLKLKCKFISIVGLGLRAVGLLSLLCKFESDPCNDFAREHAWRTKIAVGIPLNEQDAMLPSVSISSSSGEMAFAEEYTFLLGEPLGQQGRSDML